MNNRTKRYHAAKASLNPNHYKELQFDTVEMLGISDEELLEMGTPEDLQEYKTYLANREPVDPAQVWKLNSWLAELIELPLSEIFTPAEALEYKRLLRLHDPDYPKNWSFARLWMMGVTEEDIDQIMTPAEKLQYREYAERTTRHKGIGVDTYLSDTTPEEMVASGYQVFVHDDQQNRFSISPDGELLNLVSWNQMGSRSVEIAINMGAFSFECYDIYLPQYFTRFSFVEDSRRTNPCSGAPEIVLLKRKTSPSNQYSDVHWDYFPAGYPHQADP